MRKLNSLKLLLSALLLAIGCHAWGEDVTFDYADYKGKGTTSQGSDYTMDDKTYVSIGDTKFFGNNSQAHFYAGGKITVTPKASATITKVSMTCTSTGYNGYQSSGKYTPSIGSVAKNSNDATIVEWTGSATSAFTIDHDKQIRWTSIVVTYTTGGTQYDITIDDKIVNGEVSANATKATEKAIITLTATPNPGYKFASWSVTNASTSAAIEVTENKFTMPAANVNVSAAFTALPKHTAHFSVNGEIDANKDKEVSEGTAITFPEEPAGILGKKFQGWTKTADYSSATTAPSDLCKAADMGTGDVTFYAVFADVEASGYEWQKITAVNQVVAGIYALISTDEAAYVPNAAATNSCPSVVAVSKSNEKISVIDAMKWTVTGDNTNGYNFESVVETGKYLWGGSANDGTRVNTTSSKANATKDWYVKSITTYGVVLYNKATSSGRYLKTNGTSDWRNYDTDPDNTNRAANLYKLVDGTIITNYTTTVTTSYTREDLTAGNYGTICLPYGVAADAYSGATIYNVGGVTKQGDAITGIVLVEEEGALVAGKPYIFQASANEIVLTYSGEPADVQPANGLVGNLGEEKTIAASESAIYYYVLSGTTLYHLAGSATATIGKNKAYLNLEGIDVYQAPAQTQSRVAIIPVNGQPTALENSALNAEVKKVVIDGQMMIIRGGNMFDLNGRLVK